jgi:hypothetical protein
MPSHYKMKNSALHMGAKHGSPIQGNYGSPNKDYSVNKGSHDHPHAPTKYTGHYNDPRMAQGSGAENEVLHGSGQATVQAPIAMKGSASPAKNNDEVKKSPGTKGKLTRIKIGKDSKENQDNTTYYIGENRSDSASFYNRYKHLIDIGKKNQAKKNQS